MYDGGLDKIANIQKNKMINPLAFRYQKLAILLSNGAILHAPDAQIQKTVYKIIAVIILQTRKDNQV